MNRIGALVIAAAIIVAGALVALALYLSEGRFWLSKRGGNGLWRVDKQTGQVCFFFFDDSGKLVGCWPQPRDTTSTLFVENDGVLTGYSFTTPTPGRRGGIIDDRTPPSSTPTPAKQPTGFIDDVGFPRTPRPGFAIYDDREPTPGRR